ncbi:hypothetical protein B0I35DRAFT_505288 [Stachybotrys elegans]|uniref:Uncharacterized protein n=1 Tax=Stachybotrys elegans TaxID=80388 RepID=A0A8K0STW5_9HYPO|nr:hypothetical protein B0I35DRAFT_505288 [Stachybotrys elegans]
MYDLPSPPISTFSSNTMHAPPLIYHTFHLWPVVGRADKDWPHIEVNEFEDLAAWLQVVPLHGRRPVLRVTQNLVNELLRASMPALDLRRLDTFVDESRAKFSGLYCAIRVREILLDALRRNVDYGRAERGRLGLRLVRQLLKLQRQWLELESREWLENGDMEAVKAHLEGLARGWFAEEQFAYQTYPLFAESWVKDEEEGVFDHYR